MSYRAIIFDLDGTLLNTLQDLGESVNAVLSEKGFPPHPMDAYRFFVGDGAAVLIERALPEGCRDETVIRECHDMFMTTYRENLNKKAAPYDGIPELLDELTRRRLRLCVLSNKPHELTTRTIDETFSTWKFDLVLGQRDNIPKKPDPTGAIEIADCLAMAPSDVLYLGDTAVDMKTAASAGMAPVGALWGFRDRSELLKSGAKHLIDTPLKLIGLLE